MPIHLPRPCPHSTTRAVLCALCKELALLTLSVTEDRQLWSRAQRCARLHTLCRTCTGAVSSAEGRAVVSAAGTVTGPESVRSISILTGPEAAAAGAIPACCSAGRTWDGQLVPSSLTSKPMSCKSAQKMRATAVQSRGQQGARAVLPARCSARAPARLDPSPVQRLWSASL